jgi:hypothetical protein
MDDTEPAAFEALAPALRCGYERLCPWPEAYEGEIDCFRAAAPCGWPTMWPRIRPSIWVAAGAHGAPVGSLPGDGAAAQGVARRRQL